LEQPPYEWMSQTIQKLTLTADGVRVTAEMTTVKTITDTAGQYGPQGRTHRKTENTTFRDEWIKEGGVWRLKMREQVGVPKLTVDKPRQWSSSSADDLAQQAFATLLPPAEVATLDHRHIDLLPGRG